MAASIAASSAASARDVAYEGYAVVRKRALTRTRLSDSEDAASHLDAVIDSALLG